jgi:outer membrane usher protein
VKAAALALCLSLPGLATASGGMAVLLGRDEQANVQLLVRGTSLQEPELAWSGARDDGRYRLVLAWSGTRLPLEQPLPTVTSDAGPVQRIDLRADGERTRLEVQLDRSVQPWLRRAPGGWVVRLLPDAAAPVAPVPVSPPGAPPATVVAAAVIAPPRVPASGTPARPAQRQETPPAETLLLDLTVNGQKRPGIAKAEQDGAVLLLASSAWTEAGLAPGATPATLSDGTPAFALESVPGLTYSLDRGSLGLEIQAPATAFVGSTLGPSRVAAVPTGLPAPGALVNYDVSVTRPAVGQASVAGVLEAVASGAGGSLVASGLYTDNAAGRAFTRLDTTWLKDMPGRMETLVVGDTVGVGGGWSRPARFGGIRWGRNFGTQPGFVTMPQLSLAGEAALPSTVDVLVNNVRRLSQPVTPGPFDIRNVPIFSGAGELNLVVRDLLGRETVVRQSYYASPRLLAPGLDDFSFEAGRLRTGWGRDSRYGDTFGAATWRRGLTAAVTAEGRAELQAGRTAAGLEVAGLLGDWAVARAAVAAARSDLHGYGEQGALVSAGIERRTVDGGASLQLDHAQAGFAPFGEGEAPTAPLQRVRQRLFATIGGRLAGPVSGGANYIRQSRRDGELVEAVGVFLGVPVGRASLSVNVNRRLDNNTWSAGLNLSMPLEDGVHTAAVVDRQASGQLAASVSAARNLPAGPGAGWRVEGSNLPGQRARGGVQVRTEHAEYAADAVVREHGQVDARAGARGSFGIVGGAAFASRPIGQGSFAVVEVPAMPGVPVRLSNQVVAHTDANGRAFVPGLLPWQKNDLEIDAADLPMDADVAETTRQVVPWARAGEVVTFAVTRSRQLLLVLQQPGGRPVPVGTRVSLDDGQVFEAGARGEVWMAGLPAGPQQVRVAWNGGGCRLQLPDATAQDGLPPRVGPLVCGDKETP